MNWKGKSKNLLRRCCCSFYFPLDSLGLVSNSRMGRLSEGRGKVAGIKFSSLCLTFGSRDFKLVAPLLPIQWNFLFLFNNCQSESSNVMDRNETLIPFTYHTSLVVTERNPHQQNHPGLQSCRETHPIAIIAIGRLLCAVCSQLVAGEHALKHTAGQRNDVTLRDLESSNYRSVLNLVMPYIITNGIKWLQPVPITNKIPPWFYLGSRGGDLAIAMQQHQSFSQKEETTLLWS